MAWSTLRGSQDQAVALLLGALIVFVPLRGGWLVPAGELLDDRDALLLVNAIPPSVVFGAALWLLVARRGHVVPDVRRGLGLAFAVTLAVVLLSFATQDVGLKLYAIGAAQYLTYPLAALLAATVWRPGDAARLCLLLAGMSLVVALSVFAQAADLVAFVQAADARPPGQQARYGGATGSYLHAGIFLGTCVPLLAGYVLAARRTAQAALPLTAMLIVLAALVLTAGRAGMAIAALGLVALLVSSRGAPALRLAIVVLVVPALAWPAASLLGLEPRRVTDRIASVVDPDEPANAARLRDMRAALDRFQDASPAQQLLGRGLAATGNARKLDAKAPEPVESYWLKLMTETGVVGLLLLGAIVLWGGFVFLRGVAARHAAPALRGLAAGGFGLTVDAVAFPTLEVQLLALVWWLALCAVLCSRVAEGARS
jgi:hypothetical protein